MSSAIIETDLSPEARNLHRALASLQEELEAIDYYQQRVDASRDGALKAVLAHNQGDELEHAAMLLEWLRRALPELDTQLKKFLFTSGPILPPGPGGEPDRSGLGLGSLKRKDTVGEAAP
jgi:hypothetical protein